MENSSKQFLDVKPQFIHRVIHSVDSGAKLTFLTNLVYISLDTFRQVGQNISSRIDAWLTFFSSDDPEDIIRLVEKYPEFKECYRDIQAFRQKPEELMDMISKALRETDKSTERYMVRELQKELDAKKEELQAVNEELNASREELNASREELNASREELNASREELNVRKEENAEKDKRILELQERIKQLENNM